MRGLQQMPGRKASRGPQQQRCKAEKAKATKKAKYVLRAKKVVEA